MRELTPALVDFLLGERAAPVLAELTAEPLPEREILPRLTALRRDFSADEAAALLDQARLRQRARTKFSAADRMFFTDEALQQASGETIASYRAARFSPFGGAADLGCGIGGDTLALAAAGCTVDGYDLDPVRLRLAAANAAALGLDGRTRFHHADWTTAPLSAPAAFADPARRVEGRRIFSLHEMVPPLQAILDVQARVGAMGVKVAPGVADEEIPPGAVAEFISEGGTCKEGLLWFGALRPPQGARIATLLPGGHTLSDAAPVAPLAAGPPRAILYEPDAAVIRATLVAHLGTALGAAQLDPTIAYLTSDRYLPTPFARAWHIIESAPFNLKALNRRLRALGPGEVIVKKRGAPIDPDSFVKRLKTTPGGPVLTLFVTRVTEAPWMILGEEIMA